MLLTTLFFVCIFIFILCSNTALLPHNVPLAFGVYEYIKFWYIQMHMDKPE